MSRQSSRLSVNPNRRVMSAEKSAYCASSGLPLALLLPVGGFWMHRCAPCHPRQRPSPPGGSGGWAPGCAPAPGPGGGPGEPLQAVLADLPVGAWVMSALLDAAGGPAAEGAADLLVAVGVVAAVPAAAAGLNDWSDTAGPETRVGLVHATVNTTALSLYLVSVVARARGRRRGGKALGLAGLGGAAGWCRPGRAPVLRHGRGCQPHRVGAAAGRRGCWPTPNWPTGNTVRPTRAACRSRGT